MTTGKPQQMAAETNSSDDLIAELSKLMAQDAHGNRQDVKPPQNVTPAPDFSVRPTFVPADEGQVAPFAVRIPGAAPLPAAEPTQAPPSPRFDFSHAAEPVAAIPRQEPSLAPAPVAPTPMQPASPPIAASSGEPAPFHFDFNFDQPSQQSAPQQLAAAAPPAMSPATDDHDAIADLIAAELLGEMTAPIATAPAPTAAAEPAPVRAAPPEPVAQAPEAAKAGEPAKVASWMPMTVAPNLSDRPAQARPVLRPVNLTPLPRAENPAGDTFRIPPVFGLGTTPFAPIVPPAAVAPAPEPPVAAKPRAEHGYLSPVPVEPAMAPPANDLEADRDPIDEIESLIGRAVRVELEQQQIRQPAAGSLATPSMTQPALPPGSGADEAILAAAAATGAKIGWVNHDEDHSSGTAEEPQRGREHAPRRSGMLRTFAGPLVAVALLLAAGFGLYSVLGLGGTDGPAPVLVADTAPIKQVPEAKSPAEQVQQSIVFNEMDGVVPGAEEQLVSRDQADVNEVTAIPPTASVTDEGLANRKVRTVTVRPDGSIVSGEDSVAGAAILPVDRPNVPAVPGAETASPSLLASANAAQPIPAAPASVAAAPLAPLVPGTEIPVVDTAGAPVAGKTAPVPYARPASVGDAPATGPVNAVIDRLAVPQIPANAVAAQPENLMGNEQALATERALTQSGGRTSTATDTGAAATPAVAYAQLSSQRSPEVAQQVAKDLSARYASLLNGTQLEISRADLGERGTYYRVRVPATSQAVAAQFCASVVASGGDCLAM